MPKKSVPIKLGGKTYNFRFDFNALCEFSHTIDIPISEIGDKSASQMGPWEIRALIWAGLIWENPDLTVSDVGDMIEFSELGYIAEKAVEAFEAAFPEKEGEKAEKNEPSPKESSGTGKNT